MDPKIRLGQPPPFYELEEYVFQDLCRDLFDAEPEVATCEVYGTRGQRQHGIDLLARWPDSDGIEVGQCKCYEKFPPAEIRAASEEFWRHYETHWHRANVKRFILFVACDLSSTQQQNEITKQTENFAGFDITYEVWSAVKIRNKLRPHPAIVLTYLPNAEHWVRVICGVALPTLAPTDGQETRRSVAVEAALLDRVEHLESGEAERQLESMRTGWREGRREEAIRLLGSLKNDARWSTLSPRTRAKLLRFEAGVRLEETGDIELATRLADEAKRLSPSDDEARVRSLIVRKESGPEAAIEWLVGQQDVDALNLKAGLLLETKRADRAEECRATLDFEDRGLEPNAETFRIRALSHLVSRDLDRAQLEIQKAKERGPSWESVRFTAAMIDYLSSLSPAALSVNKPVAWPEPVDWHLVKRDDGSTARLREAARVFEVLATSAEEPEERRRLETWRLACLANNPEGQEEAVGYCRTLLDDDPAHYRAVLWAVARGFNVDLGSSEAALEELVSEGPAEYTHVLALTSCYFVSDRPSEAIELLDRTKPMFQEARAGVLWSFWHAQALTLAGDPEAAVRALDACCVDWE